MLYEVVARYNIIVLGAMLIDFVCNDTGSVNEVGNG